MVPKVTCCPPIEFHISISLLSETKQLNLKIEFAIDFIQAINNSYPDFTLLLK